MTKTAMEMIGEARAQVGTVAPKEAADELGTGAVLVDVREPEEWQHGHINGSVPAPRGLLEFFADQTSPRHKQALDPTRRVIVVCASGARASLAAATLKTMGYQDVAILDGGLKGWTEAGLPTNEHEYSGI
ncbi:MAG: rhodanese-like domain-containing protein [Gemmatimonadales bacterium]